MRSPYNKDNNIQLLHPVRVINNNSYPSLKKLNIAPYTHSNALKNILDKQHEIKKTARTQVLDQPNPNPDNSQKSVFKFLQKIISPDGVALPALTRGPTPPNFPQGHKQPHLWEHHQVVCVRQFIDGNVIHIPIGHITSHNVLESVLISNLSYDKPIPLYIRPYKLTDYSNLTFLTDEDILIHEPATKRFSSYTKRIMRPFWY